MKAIETEYNGILFRSRLEARWAILFDSLDLEYVYEPECFILDNNLKYTPDFYLPIYDIYLEIKPNKDWLKNPYHYNRYKCFSKTLLILDSNYPKLSLVINSNAYFDGCVTDNTIGVMFLPNTKYEPLFYHGEKVGHEDEYYNEYYKKNIDEVKKYRFYK